MFGFFKSAKATQTKSAISNAEAISYVEGGNRPLANRSFQAYLEASSRLDTVIRTSASVASSAKFLYGKVDMKDTFKKAKFKQADGLYMNDYQTESDFLFELIGTLMTYDKVLIIPEESKYPFRKGMIDYTIVADDKFQVNLGKNQTIESFTYIAGSGARIEYKYSDVIYITRNLTANNLIYAIPKLKALMKTIESIVGIHNFAGEYIGSGGKNSVIVSSDTMLNEDQARKVRQKFQEFLNSTAPKAMLMNSEKFTVNKISDGLNTSGVLEMMTQLSDEILKAYNMPSYLLGEYSSSTQGGTVLYANRTWFQIQLRPLFNTLSIAFTRHFRDSFGIKNAMVKFDFSNIELLEDSDTEKLKYASDANTVGFMSLDEARVHIGLEPLDTDASKKHYAAAYLLGQAPVAYESFDEDVARNSNNNAGTNDGANSTDTGTPSGSGGDSNVEGLSGAV